MAANRRLAFRAIAAQAVMALLVALAFLFQGALASLAAGVGGAAVIAGNLLLAWRSFAAPAPSAGLALWGVAAGVGMKWLLVLMVLFLALGQSSLPPLPMLVGVVTTTTGFLMFGKPKL